MKKTNSNSRVEIENAIQELRENNCIKESKYGNISSFDFNRKAFYKDNWSKQRIKVRGLHIDTEKATIVARGYDKFFNLGESKETQHGVVEKKFNFPLTVYVKENGFLGLVSYDESKDDLFIAAKSSVNSAYAKWFAEMVYKKVSKENRDKMKKYARDNKVTFLFECIDMEHASNVIEYAESGIYLLDIVKNQLDFEKYEYTEMCKIAHQFGLVPKEKACTLSNLDEYWKWFNGTMGEGYLYKDTRVVEGFVLEDSSGFVVKSKTYYYIFWRLMRCLAQRTLKYGYVENEDGISALLDRIIAEQFYAWLKDYREQLKLKQSEDFKKLKQGKSAGYRFKNNICTLRNMYYKQAH